MIFEFLSSLFILLLPAALLWLEPKVKLIEWLSPAFFCYALGIVFTNLPGLPDHLRSPHMLLNASVGIAIPMLLFPADIKSWLRLAPKTALALGIWIGSIALCALLSHFVFQDVFEQTNKMAAMATGVYIGGTANLAAISKALGVPEAFFVKMNLSDLLLSGMLLMFLLGTAHKLFLRFLPAFPNPEKSLTEDSPFISFDQLIFKKKVGNTLLSILYGMLALGISAGISFLIWGKLEDTFLIISLSIMGLLFSLIQPIRELPGNYETGQYIFLVFCVAAGALVDLDSLQQGILGTVGFMAVVAYGGFILHSFLCYWAKVDADTALITATAGIYGPPFIGPVAQVMKNREIVISGMTLGVMGLAIGNFVGLLIYAILGGG